MYVVNAKGAYNPSRAVNKLPMNLAIARDSSAVGLRTPLIAPSVPTPAAIGLWPTPSLRNATNSSRLIYHQGSLIIGLSQSAPSLAQVAKSAP